MDEQKVYLQSVKAPMRRFEILGWDKETKQMRLKTASGIEFEYENMTKEKAQQFGYKLVKE